MGFFTYKISFEINYFCQYGESLVILGNIPELGNWDLRKGLRLQYKEKDIWFQTVQMKLDNTTGFQYKYAVESNGKILRWEEGPNRILNLRNCSKLRIILNDVWSYKRLSIRLNNSFKNKLLYISGNVPSLGQFEKLEKMRLINRPYRLASFSPDRFNEKNSQKNDISSPTSLKSDSKYKISNAEDITNSNSQISNELIIPSLNENDIDTAFITENQKKSKKQNFKQSLANTIPEKPFILIEEKKDNPSLSAGLRLKKKEGIIIKNDFRAAENTRKNSFHNEDSFWEKNFLIPNDFPSSLLFNFYALDLENSTFSLHDQEFEVNLGEDLAPENHMWSPQTGSVIRQFKKQYTLSPLKFKREKSGMKINLGQKRPERIEIRHNVTIFFNQIELKPDYREITAEICIGNNVYDHYTWESLLIRKISVIVIFKKANMYTKYCSFDDFASDFGKKNNIQIIEIYSYQINLNDNSNLMAWAQNIDNLTKKNKIFLCWSDCQKEMFEILAIYLSSFKHFSISAARKYLRIKRIC